MNKVFIVFGLADKWQTILEVFSSRESAEAFCESIPGKDDPKCSVTYYPYNGNLYEAILIGDYTVKS
jgi:hypothetical protein